jgi:hypothetical protein
VPEAHIDRTGLKHNATLGSPAAVADAAALEPCVEFVDVNHDGVTAGTGGVELAGGYRPVDRAQAHFGAGSNLCFG